MCKWNLLSKILALGLTQEVCRCADFTVKKCLLDGVFGELKCRKRHLSPLEHLPLALKDMHWNFCGLDKGPPLPCSLRLPGARTCRSFGEVRDSVGRWEGTIEWACGVRVSSFLLLLLLWHGMFRLVRNYLVLRGCQSSQEHAPTIIIPSQWGKLIGSCVVIHFCRNSCQNEFCLSVVFCFICLFWSIVVNRKTLHKWNQIIIFNQTFQSTHKLILKKISWHNKSFRCELFASTFLIIIIIITIIIIIILIIVLIIIWSRSLQQ